MQAYLAYKAELGEHGQLLSPEGCMCWLSVASSLTGPQPFHEAPSCKLRIYPHAQQLWVCQTCRLGLRERLNKMFGLGCQTAQWEAWDRCQHVKGQSSGCKMSTQPAWCSLSCQAGLL